jgi:hypothetical protein
MPERQAACTEARMLKDLDLARKQCRTLRPVR